MALPDATRFYINGQWITPEGAHLADLIDPSTEEAIGKVALGTPDDADRAVQAARAAFEGFSAWPVAQRVELLEAINAKLIERNDDIAAAISAEMGAPQRLSKAAQAPSGTQHFTEVIKVLKEFPFEERLGTTTVRHEPIGVCALITPWNWPINQTATKVAPALAAGCTMVLKPSELAPLDAVILTEIIDEAGAPAGVFNLVHGDGLGVGQPLSMHPEVDMVSFTGSVRAGVAISESAAPSVKRVALELGGKSANIILPDADLQAAIRHGVTMMMVNTGQSCNAPSRILVPRDKLDEVCDIAEAVASGMSVGAPESGASIGPIANRGQFGRVLNYIEMTMEEGARLVSGGAGRPTGQDKGYFVQPTVFRDVTPDMTIAREEVFGPVLAIMAYDDIDEAVAIANDSDYGLSGYVWGADLDAANAVASRLRTGMVHVNGAGLDAAAPFGGYKMSGNGREWGRYGLEEFLEVKSVYGARSV
ncbi:MAG: aldehyde dehydrogenase family protein [Pseudomonadota bacterium]